MKIYPARTTGAFFAFVLITLSGCSYLPEINLPINRSDTATEALFVGDAKGTTARERSRSRVASAPSGLQIRKAERGNMDSYVVRGQRYYTMDSSDGYSARGQASWYGPNFHGRTASSGEVYDMYRMTAAHKTLPLPTYAEVTHLQNGRSVLVKINDRGPFSGDRIIDLSFAAALRLGMVNEGTAMVEIKALSPEELMKISGPDNSLGVDFYYAGDENQTPLAPVQTAQVAEQLTTVKPVDIDDAPITALANDASLLGDTQPAAAPLPTAEVVASNPLPAVVVPARKPESTDQLLATDDTASGDTPAPLKADDNLLAADLESGKAVQKSVGDGLVMVSAGSVAATVPNAVQKVNVAAEKSRNEYYVQAGVFPLVADAERVAVDAVLAVPEEEVHVKPLKDSSMYRVTVGPIVNYKHAQEVSSKLTAAGVENFAVKVK